MTEAKTAPYVPLSHPFVERLVGTIRQKFLDHTPFWNARDLQRKLLDFRDYYNNHRVHASLDGVAPRGTSGEMYNTVVDLGDYRWQRHCRGLYELPIAA